jgi:2-octaprenyl-6-methoxyphenol hydroxylase
MPSTQPLLTDTAVIGGGPAGFAAALALATSGAKVAHIARRGAVADNRTSALLHASIVFLTHLQLWGHLEPDAVPLRVMRLIDDTDRLLRAPEVRFAAAETGLDAFGYNLINSQVVAAMEARAAELPNLTRFDEDAAEIVPGTDAVAITTQQGMQIEARLVVGADGRHSPSRAAAGIAVTHRALPQTAVTFNIAHTRPHHEMSTEFHTAQGPCALVPARGNRSNVVWVVTPDKATELLALSDSDLADAIERQSRSILGQCTVEPGRFAFPLSFDAPRVLAANRIALVGESAHVVPPLGAQGLNLGLRDAAMIAELATDALAQGGDPGGDAIMRAYDRARRSDVSSRSFVIDITNRSLISDFPPLQAMRALGMHLISGIRPLRERMLREGIAPSYSLPRMMREDYHAN